MAFSQFLTKGMGQFIASPKSDTSSQVPTSNIIQAVSPQSISVHHIPHANVDLGKLLGLAKQFGVEIAFNPWTKTADITGTKEHVEKLLNAYQSSNTLTNRIDSTEAMHLPVYESSFLNIMPELEVLDKKIAASVTTNTAYSLASLNPHSGTPRENNHPAVQKESSNLPTSTSEVTHTEPVKEQPAPQAPVTISSIHTPEAKVIPVTLQNYSSMLLQSPHNLVEVISYTDEADKPREALISSSLIDAIGFYHVNFSDNTIPAVITNMSSSGTTDILVEGIADIELVGNSGIDTFTTTTSDDDQGVQGDNTEEGNNKILEEQNSGNNTEENGEGNNSGGGNSGGNGGNGNNEGGNQNNGEGGHGIGNDNGAPVDINLVGTDSNNTLSGDSGNDTLSGLGGNDTLSGNNGNDILYGGNGEDSLNGGAGNDTLYGNNGKDTLTGGSGSDRFVFGNSDSSASNPDTITDFSRGEDLIDLSAVSGISDFNDLTLLFAANSATIINTDSDLRITVSNVTALDSSDVLV